MKRTIVLLLITILCACASPLEPQKKAFIQKMDKFVGKSVDNLVAANGLPTEVFTLEAGGRMFEYFHTRMLTEEEQEWVVGHAKRQRKKYSPQIPDTRPPSRTQPGGLRKYVLSAGKSCVLLFKISADNIVVSWSMEGEGCY